MNLKLLSKAAHRPLIAMILFQVFCALFFVYDATKDMGDVDFSVAHMIPEILATIGLVVGIAFEMRALVDLLSREARMAHSLGVASGALADMMEAYFTQWGLTPAERDVAAFTIKGFAITEIADLRSSAEGTVKTHLNAIYRKAGVSGRAQLVSLLVEDLLNAPLVPGVGAGRAGKQNAADPQT